MAETKAQKDIKICASIVKTNTVGKHTFVKTIACMGQMRYQRRMGTSNQNPAVWVLTQERDRASAELDRLQSEIKAVRYTLRSVEDAIAILTGQPAVARPEGVTLKELVMEQVRATADGMTPLEIANAITLSGRETSNTSVSSILSRLKKDEAVYQKGDRWHAIKTDKAPDTSMSEAFEELGPATGRGTVFPATPPEGSIPSGSTDVQDLRAGLENVRRTLPTNPRDLDDDIPF